MEASFQFPLAFHLRVKGKCFLMINDKYNKTVHWFAVLTACATFLLIIAGGMVTSTGSGLAVPDWPLSYGQLMPPMVGGIFYEHGHRMVASFVGLLMVILTIIVWRKEQRRWVRMIALAGLTAVIVQGMLGGLTVLFLLPTAISVSHATLAQTFFCITVSLAFFTSKWWMLYEQEGKRPSVGQAAIFLAAFLAVYMQLIFGALMRHTGSGLAVPDFPLAYGQLFPSLNEEAMATYNQFLINNHVRLAAEGPITEGQILIHMLHRMWAVVVSALVILASIRLYRSSFHSSRLKILSVLLVATLVLQVALGAIVVLLRKHPELTTAHVANGALMLALCLLSVLHMLPFGERARESFVATEGKVAIS